MTVTLQDGTPHLKELPVGGERRPPAVIDRLFTSVAIERGSNTARIVLSGAGGALD